MRVLTEREVAIQIWSGENPNAVDLEGPTAHIPDYFSELYGTVLGWLIYVADADPIKLKRLVMSLEQSDPDRLADIDVFTSYFDKVSRRDLGE